MEAHESNGNTFFLGRKVILPEISNEGMTVKRTVKRRGRIEGLGLKAVFVEAPKKGRVVRMERKGAKG